MQIFCIGVFVCGLTKKKLCDIIIKNKQDTEKDFTVLKNIFKPEKIKKSLPDILLYIVLAALLTVILSQKINFNLDEIYSYGLANYTQGMNLIVHENHRYQPASDAYMEYVSATDRFNYANVWHNQAIDVHPPLFYALVHTVCSLFPYTFSVWYVGVINITFSLLTLFFVQKLAAVLTDDKICRYFVSVMYVLCWGISFSASFMRMYIMAMFQVTCITYLIAKRIVRRDGRWFYLQLAAVAVMGALTHYYCIVYTVLICGVYFVILLSEKNFAQSAGLVAAGAAAGGVSVGIFPAMINHIFFSYRGEESFENLGGTLQEYLDRLRQFFTMLNNDVFGGAVAAVIAAVLVLAVVLRIKKISCAGISCRVKQYIAVLLPSAIYLMLVSKIAVYNFNRYINPIYAVVLCGVICLLFGLMRRLMSKKAFICCAAAVCVLLSAANYKNCCKVYQYESTQPLLEFAQQSGSRDCLYLIDGVAFHYMPSFKEVSCYGSVTFVNYNNPGFLWSVDYSGNDELVVLVAQDNPDALQQVLDEYPQFTVCDKIGRFGYAATYYLHG